MDLLEEVESRIKLFLNRLKELETLEYRKTHTNEELTVTRKFVSDTFKSLLVRRDEIKRNIGKIERDIDYLYD
jgi:hypothetical protein